MSIIFGTNTVMSTWRNTVPLMCVEETNLLSQKIAKTIKEAEELGIIKDHTAYTEFIKLFNNMDDLCDLPVTLFAFDNNILNYFFDKSTQYELHKLGASHTVKGLLTEDLIQDKVVRMTSLSRKQFHIMDDKIFHFVDRVPVIVSNIIEKYTVLDNNMNIYFIDMPIYTKQNLLLDASV